MNKEFKTSITVNDEEQAVAFMLALLRRVWSTDAQKRCIRAVAAFYGMTVEE